MMQAGRLSTRCVIQRRTGATAYAAPIVVAGALIAPYRKGMGV